MPILNLIFITTLGLLFGSFFSAYTSRFETKDKIIDGRSRCDHCKKLIYWYDNIPLLSYLLLGGKCRHCHKSIAISNPLIEASTAILFLLTYLNYEQISSKFIWLSNLGIFGLVVILISISIGICIFVIDWEHQIIPDTLSLSASLLIFIVILLSGTDQIYVHLLTGFSCAFFFLVIHMITKGRGMGLGDAKLALFLGIFLGPLYSPVWLFVSFAIGAVFGIILLSLGKAGMKTKIAFGPFLLAGFWISLFVNLMPIVTPLTLL